MGSGDLWHLETLRPLVAPSLRSGCYNQDSKCHRYLGLSVELLYSKMCLYCATLLGPVLSSFICGLATTLSQVKVHFHSD